MDLITPLLLAALLLGWAAHRQRRRAKRRPHPYRLARVLGEGGQARVHEARHPGTGCRVALKLPATERAHRRLRREAEILARIRHPGVVRLLDDGETLSRRPWMALELVEGFTLHDLVRSRGPLPPRRAAYLLGEIASALQAVHAEGVVHGDLKPSNVMIGHDGKHATVKLLDFGLARKHGAPPTKPGKIMGTPAFMAPEVITAEHATRLSDVYGLGLVAYVLLTGKIPFVGHDDTSLMRQHLLVPPPPPEVWVDLPAGFSAIVERCLDKCPERRPALEDLRRELAFLAQGWGRRAEAAWWRRQLNASAPLPLLRPAVGVMATPSTLTADPTESLRSWRATLPAIFTAAVSGR